jgi:PD-(D/E)XK nuclease superfamily protein
VTTTTTETSAPSQDTPRRPLSISQLQLWYRCGYAWQLRYGLGHSPRAGAGAWFGRLMHEMIELMYRGMRMDAAHQQVWMRECGPVWGEVQQLIALDAAYAAQGRPTSSAAKKWREENRAYDLILARLADFQQHALGHARWGKTHSLADYYRRAVTLLASEGEILLEHPLLVEGIPISELRNPHDEEARPSGSAAALAGDAEDALVDIDEDGRGTRYRLLAGAIAGVEVVGVPDVLARDAEGNLCVADYKTGRPISHGELAQSAQLALYLELLRQNGYITEDDRVRIGHIYLTESGVLPIWVDDVQQVTMLHRLGRQLNMAAALIDNGLFSDRKGLDVFQSPCAFCDVAHVCDA